MKKIKYGVIDLFAGAGGFGLGFEMSNFQLKLSLEIDKWAVETLFANNKEDAIILQDDIRKYSSLSEIRCLFDGTPDVIIGGPPCQGFSIASTKADANDPRNTLFMEFARWVEYFSPKIFVMENVQGILNRKNSLGEKVIDIIKDRFAEIGYNVEIWNLNAAEYGVPQMRKRIFIVGNSLNRQIGAPEVTHTFSKSLSNPLLQPAVTIEQAISDLPIINAGEGAEIMSYHNNPLGEYQMWARGCNTLVYNHEAMKHTKRMIDRYKEIQNGVSYEEISDTLKVRRRNGQGEHSDIKFQSNYRHLKNDMISHTIPASFYSNFIHPTLPRNITSREAARIQSFPDSYVFKGKRTQISSKLLKRLGKEDSDHLSQYNQIGNAVPPLLAKAIASKIAVFLDENYSVKK